jgi:hypothetical protein
MRPIANIRWIIALLTSLISAYVWSVSQSGVGTVNRNVCELLRRHFANVSVNCSIDDWIFRGSGIVFCFCILYLLWHVSSYLFNPRSWATKIAALKNIDISRRQSTQAGSKPFELSLGTGASYEFIAAIGINRGRTVRVKIRNNTDTLITQGKLFIYDLDPPFRDNSQYLLREMIAIDRHGEYLVDVATYAEGTSVAPPGTWINLNVPRGGFAFAESLPLLPVRSHTMRLHFVNIDGQSDDVFCRLYVDDTHVLHLEDWGDSSKARLIPPSSHVAYVPLYDAALHAHEELPNSMADVGRRTFSDDPNQLIVWWCYVMAPKLKIFGERAPSRRREIYSDQSHRNDYDLFVEHKKIVAREREGNGSWTNLCVQSNELEGVIQELKKATT